MPGLESGFGVRG